MCARRHKRDPPQGPPEFDEYTLTTRGELLGSVEVPAGERLGPGFAGYFHPARAFSRVVGLFDEWKRAADRLVRLYDTDFTASPSPVLRRGHRLDVSEALARARVAQDIASQALVDLGLELSDSSGRRLETSFINIERVRIEQETERHEFGLIGPSPFEEIDAGIEVTPYRLSAYAPSEEEPDGPPSRGPRWGVPWSPAKERDEAAEDGALASADEEWSSEDEDGRDDEYEWEGNAPSLEDRVALWHRAVTGHRRDTLFSVLDLASTSTVDDDDERDHWVKSVQRARAEGVMDVELSHYLIWRIVTNAEEQRMQVVDPLLLELMDRMEPMPAKYGVSEMADLDQMTDPPAEWLDIHKACDARRSQLASEVLLSAGESALVAAMHERPEEFAARMAVWDARMEREDAERRGR